MGNERRARAYASEELLEHWETYPRLTFARFERQWLEAREEPSRDVLGFIDQTIYANEDSSSRVVWRNDEVLELLRELRELVA